MSTELTTDLPKDVLPVETRKRKGRFTDNSRFFVMNGLKLVRFVAEDEIRALEAFYHQDLCDLLAAKKGERK
ncbi:hypothetical protein Q8W37_15420 [Shimia thalassica]|uniref:hypothetical protein n=1 Tax=Shimia thalassica TaxID=1715693 RepID=UPI002735A0ED|nr:hypothetical protein [Shimia thalassica]MDP2581327.1 hypothetical protein [Shimia thalassica]